MSREPSSKSNAQLLDRLAPKARAVQSVYREHRAAVAVENLADLDLLFALRETLAPALSALALRLPGSFDSEASDREVLREERGVVLVDRFRRVPRATGGAYTGDALALLERGDFARMERNGAWLSAAPSGKTPGFWTTSLEPLEPVEVVRAFGVGDIARGAEQALDARLRQAPVRNVEDILERAARLRAVCLLLDAYRPIAFGLDAETALQLFRAKIVQGTGFPVHGEDANDAAFQVLGGTGQLALGARLLARSSGPDDIAVVRLADATLLGIGAGQAGSLVGVPLGEIDETGRFRPSA